MFTIYAPMKSLMVNGSHRFASCWKITRADGVVIRLTDHDHDLVVDGETYTPTGGFNASAREFQEGVEASSLEIVGVLTSAAITHADLLAGKYRRAVISEKMVDWRFPFAGKFDEHEYVISDVEYNHQTWVATVEGELSKLKVRIGETFERRCGVKQLGDARCGADLSALQQTGRAVTAIDQDRKQFQTDIVQTFTSGYYNDGSIEWTSLPGRTSFEGTISDVKEYETTNGMVRLYVKTPFAVEIGDEFTIKPGCDRQFSTCVDKFNNGNRFRGVPHIPGNDALLQTADTVT